MVYLGINPRALEKNVCSGCWRSGLSSRAPPSKHEKNKTKQNKMCFLLLLDQVFYEQQFDTTVGDVLEFSMFMLIFT
jgi:hypothetical protein